MTRTDRLVPIKFIGRYKKMPPGVEYCDTYVKDVVVVTRFNLTQQQIDEDTLMVDGKYFELRGDKFIKVVLWTDCLPKPVEWATLRQFDFDKFKYYLGLRGQQVGIEFVKGGDTT